MEDCLCRSLQLENKHLDERLEAIRADSSSLAESRPSTVTSPRGTAVLRTLRNENEHLQQQLQVHRPSFTAPTCATCSASAPPQLDLMLTSRHDACARCFPRSTRGAGLS